MRRPTRPPRLILASLIVLSGAGREAAHAQPLGILQSLVPAVGATVPTVQQTVVAPARALAPVGAAIGAISRSSDLAGAAINRTGQATQRTVGATTEATAPLVRPTVDLIQTIPQASPRVLVDAVGHVVSAAPRAIGGLVSSTPGLASAATSALPPPPARMGFSSGNASGLLGYRFETRPDAGMASMSAPQLRTGDQPALLLQSPPPMLPIPHKARLAERARLHADMLESVNGDVAVRGEVLAVAPTPAALRIADSLGYKIKERLDDPSLGISLVVLQAPAGVTASSAKQQLDALDPGGAYDLNHLYAEAGEVSAAARQRAPAGRQNSEQTVGLIDHGVDVRHPSLKGVRIDQQAFAGAIVPGAHGLATASLLAGSDGRFRGAIAGGVLYVADIYGRQPTGGSALALTRALSWMALKRVPVINISLVGPRNAPVEAVIRAMVRKGHIIVAAAGNDGPNAPPLYPAAYPGVVAVTGVDAQDRVIPEAGRGPHLTFAAPGADMAAAGSAGYVRVRGTSFASPLVAARLAARLNSPDPAAAKLAIADLAREAQDLGVPGTDPVYGHGLVAEDARTSPMTVAARGLLRSN